VVLSIIIAFVLGYFLIAIEHKININKTATALLAGVICWVIYAFGNGDHEYVSDHLIEKLGDIAGILIFLLGAMTVVELIDAHDGFEVIKDLITTNKERKLLWILSILAFFLSAILDNLTTTIVMISILRKLMAEGEKRLYFSGMIIIAANAGGAWSPIGDVTTTMLWIGGQVTSANIIVKLIAPSLVCLCLPALLLSFKFKGIIQRPAKENNDTLSSRSHRNIIFFSGIGVLLFVPVFKTITHLPPFMGMMFGLGILWIISEIIHKDKDEADKHKYSVAHALRKVDTPSILFFLGILLAISALDMAGQLKSLAGFLDDTIGNTDLIVLSIGLVSAIVDNVPLVAASMGMYDLSVYPTDHYFWEFLAYCTGTGGSALIIGSAAGVAAMGIEKINFIWYLKKISWLALLGYLSGALVFILQHKL
jgi:Na+/H+ antiporter NhaD/arsenite permease-like protein